jgi:hypothetical protein
MVSTQEAIEAISIDGRYEVPKAISTSYLGVRAGDIVSLTYNGRDRFGFILKSGRSGVDGVWGAVKTNNTLLNFVGAEEISAEDFMDIVDKLYDNEVEAVISNFSYVRSLGSPLTSKYTGSDKFRTLNVQQLSGTNIFIIPIYKVK